MIRHACAFGAMAAAAGTALGQITVASEDFDGGAVGLISSVVPALDGGAGDWFGVGSRNAWPQGFPSPGIPFSIADDSVFGYANGTPFAGDLEGIYGQNSNLDNNYFAMSDSDEFGLDQTATWTFDISGFTDLRLSIDMGGMADGNSFGGYDLASFVNFSYSIDAGPSANAFDVRAVDASTSGFVYRPMDSGSSGGTVNVLQAGGDNPVSKLLAEDRSVSANLFLDKTPAAGAGEGELDTYVTSINGTGSTLTLTLTADMPFEAMVFDNIRITGVPAPSAAVLLGIAGAATLRRKR